MCCVCWLCSLVYTPWYDHCYACHAAACCFSVPSALCVSHLDSLLAALGEYLAHQSLWATCQVKICLCHRQRWSLHPGQSAHRLQHVQHLSLSHFWFQVACGKRATMARVSATSDAGKDEGWGQHPPPWHAAFGHPPTECMPSTVMLTCLLRCALLLLCLDIAE